MSQKVSLFFALFLFLVFAKPLPAASNPDVQSLTQIYDRYNSLMGSGNEAQAEQMRTKEKSEGFEIKINPKNAAEKRKMKLFFLSMIPQSYTVEHSEFSADGKKAELNLLADLKSPDGKLAKSEITLSFTQVASEWKIAKIIFGVDPSQIKRSPDTAYEPEKNYNPDKDVNIGGRIIKTEYQKDYTLVVVRVLDEEYLAYLPSKKDLEKTKFDLKHLQPWKIISIQGLQNLNNPLKIWALKIDAVPTEL